MPTVDALETALLELTGSTDPHPRLLVGAPPPLLRLRESAAKAMLEAPQLGVYRRRRLVAWDRERVTWEAWDPGALERVLVQTARLGRARLGEERSPPGVRRDGDVRVSAPFRWSVADLLPMEPDPGWVVALAGSVLRGLMVLHGQGVAHGQVGASTLVEQEGGWTLVPLHGGEATFEGDLRDFGHLLITVGAVGPMREYAETLVEAAPPDISMAVWMLRKQLASELTRARHDLARQDRSRARVNRASPLRLLAARLVGMVPPPVARGVLRAGADQSLHLIDSDGVTVRGGLVVVGDAPGLRLVGAPMPPPSIPAERWSRLPLLWDRDARDATGIRAAVRAWRTRPRGDEGRRADVQRTLSPNGPEAVTLGNQDAALDRLMRWLEASARLRAELILMRAERS